MMNNAYGFYCLFSVQFLLIASKIFLWNVKVGLFSLVLTIFFFVITLIQLCYNERTDWKAGKNLMLILYSFWSFYCIIELCNPNTVMAAWNVSIVPYAFLPLICAFLIPIIIRNVKAIECLLMIWSAFIIIVTIKALWQQHIGFSQIDRFFLYTLGGWRTHVIWSGIRYFSCFSDASTYGIHSAMAGVTFCISALYVQGKWKRIYFIFIACCGFYGMGVSGTRSAMAVVLGALIMMAFVAKSWKIISGSLITLTTLFCFFYFTNIGNSNIFIFKMRSAFRPSKDLSYQVRVENRAKMKLLMSERFLGYGLGLSKPGGDIRPRDVMPYPPDSWLVAVWVETGLLGIIIYLLVNGTLFVYGCYLLIFRVRNNQIRGLTGAWLCSNAGFFIACYANDAMQYPNSIIVYTGFALCFAAPYIDKQVQIDRESKANLKAIDTTNNKSFRLI